MPDSWPSHELQKALEVANPLVSSYLSGSFCREAALERVMVATIAEIDISGLQLGVF